MRTPVVPLLATLLVVAVPSLHAQALGVERAGTLLTRHLQHLRDDAGLPDSLRKLSIEGLLSPRNSAYARWLDDSGIQLYFVGLAALTHELPADRCGKLLDPNSDGGTDLDAMLAYSDSTSIERWGDILERVVRVRAGGHAAGRIAPVQEMQATIMAAIGRLTVEDQTRLITIARNPPPTPQDACWSVQQMMGMLSQLPPDSLGPAGRTMFGAKAGE